MLVRDLCAEFRSWRVQSCQNVFRSVRNVEGMRVSVDLSSTTPHIVFQFACKYGKHVDATISVINSQALCVPRRRHHENAHAGV